METPLRAPGLPDNLLSISESGTCAVVSLGDAQPGGRVICWGDNSAGQLGNGNWQRSATPVEVVLPDSNPRVVQVSSSGTYSIGLTTCALTTQGAIYCWGMNDSAQVGSSPATCSATCYPLLNPSTATITACGQLPQRVRLPGGTRLRATQLAGGTTYRCALTEADGVFCWGGNDVGRLGFRVADAGFSPSEETLPVGFPGDAQIVQISVSAGGAASCALDQNGRVFCWGSQTNCQLGSGPAEPFRATPTAVVFPAGVTIRRISLGGFIALALDDTGTMWAWGLQGVAPWLPTDTGNTSCDGLRNDAGAALRVGALTPVQASWFGARRFVDIKAGFQHACAIDNSGGVWCWGSGTVVPLGGIPLPDAGVDMRVAYVGSTAERFSCSP